MIKGEYDYLKNLVKFNLCAEHRLPLQIVRHPDEAQYVLRCGEGEYPDALVHNPSLTEEYKQGTLPDGPIADNIKKGERRRAMQQDKQTTAIIIGQVPSTDLVTGELLPPETVTSLVAYAEKYHLDPYRAHVVVMYGKPYITLDGYLYHANRSGKPYSLRSRPMTSLEVIEYKIEPTDFGWIAEVEFTETGTKFNGTGIVTYEEMTAKSKRDSTKLAAPVVAKFPWHLAQKRAEWHALRRAFPIGETKEESNEKGNESSLSRQLEVNQFRD